MEIKVLDRLKKQKVVENRISENNINSSQKPISKERKAIISQCGSMGKDR